MGSFLFFSSAETSMIGMIYVKSYFHPDKRKETKRKTEEVKVEPPHDTTKKVEGQSTIYKPASFKFTKGLEYRNITKEIVNEKMLNLDVCITQKYSWKSFCVASLSMPLKTAVRKLVKEKYPLNPRLSTNLPENMKVYSGKDLEITRQMGYGSIPNLRSASMRSSRSHSSHAMSDPGVNLMSVDCQMPRTPSIEINLTPQQEQEEAELQQALQQIAIMERREENTIVPVNEVKKSGYNSVFGTDLVNDIDDQIHDLEDVQVHITKKQNQDWNSDEDSDIEMGKNSQKSGKTLKTKSLKLPGLKKLGLLQNKRSGSDKSRKSLTSEGSEVRSVSPDCWEDPIGSELIPMDYEYDAPRIKTSSNNSPGSNVSLTELHQTFSPKEAFTVSADVHSTPKARLTLEDESPSPKSPLRVPDFTGKSTLQPESVNSGYSPKTKTKTSNYNLENNNNNTLEDTQSKLTVKNGVIVRNGEDSDTEFVTV